MKITLWQQFSSNHSAFFTVVGKFETEPQAEEAANKFLHILTAINDWLSQPENRQWLDDQNLEISLTPPEIQFSQEYGVDWEGGQIDWLDGEPEKRVQRIGTDLFLGVEFETWSSYTPIVELITLFGGQPKVQHSHGNHLTLHLTCKLPDETQAREIFEMVDAVFQKPIPIRVYPWRKPEERPYVSTTGRIQREGRQITIDCQFFRLDAGFPPMLNWFKSIGATDIEYTFTEEPERWEW